MDASENGAGNSTDKKHDFNIDIAVGRVRDAISGFPQAALFELADAGFDSLFEQLIACIISVRTYDEITVPTAHRLFCSGMHSCRIEPTDNQCD